MTDIGPLGHVNGALGNVFGMVTHTLNRLGQKQQIQAGRNCAWIFHHVGNQLAQKTIVLMVDLVIGLDDGQCRIGIQTGECIE